MNKKLISFLLSIGMVLPSTVGVFAEEKKDDNPVFIERISGVDRYDTSKKIADKFKDPDSIVIVDGRRYPDSLSAGVLAGKLKAPLLLVNPETKATDIGAKNVYIVGGINSVSEELETSLKQIGKRVSRLYGANRYETALAVSKDMGADKYVLVSGKSFPDALSAAVLANKEGAAILLTDSSTYRPEIYKDKTTHVVGGSVKIGEPSDWKNVNIIAGKDRYDTNRLVNALVGPKKKSLVCDGRGFADALSAGAYAIKEDADIVLCDGKTPIKFTNTPIIIGGENSVPSSLISAEKADKIKEGVDRLDMRYLFNTEVSIVDGKLLLLDKYVRFTRLGDPVWESDLKFKLDKLDKIADFAINLKIPVKDSEIGARIRKFGMDIKKLIAPLQEDQNNLTKIDFKKWDSDIKKLRDDLKSIKEDLDKTRPTL